MYNSTGGGIPLNDMRTKTYPVMFNMWMLIWQQYKFHNTLAILRMLTIAFVLLLLFLQYLLALPIFWRRTEKCSVKFRSITSEESVFNLKISFTTKVLAKDKDVSAIWWFSDWVGCDICEFEERPWKYPPIDYKWDTNLLHWSHS